MFKCLILQSLYNLSDESLKIEIYNRTSFRFFLDMNIAANVPDCDTMWKFRERLRAHELVKPLLDKFSSFLTRQGHLVKKGTIVDATFVEAPKQLALKRTKRSNRGRKVTKFFATALFIHASKKILTRVGRIRTTSVAWL